MEDVKDVEDVEDVKGVEYDDGPGEEPEVDVGSPRRKVTQWWATNHKWLSLGQQYVQYGKRRKTKLPTFYLPKMAQKIPHTGDKESLDRCG